jgi:hypothetical protein
MALILWIKDCSVGVEALDVAHTHFRREEGILKSAYPLHSSVEFAIGNLWLATILAIKREGSKIES